jgi:hypothetical protein
VFGPNYSGYAQPYYGHERPLSWAEVLSLFGRPIEAIRWLGAADSQDDLAIGDLHR